MKFDLTLGAPATRGGLTLFPLFRDSAPAADYITGPQASSTGVLMTTELEGGASVPELEVHNDGGLPVLLLEGEMLLGAKQNRTLNLSVLCAAAATTRIPVSCVERGRWGDPRKGAHSARHASISVRRTKTVSSIRSVKGGAGKRSDQGAVWAEVDARLKSIGAASPTSALEDAYVEADRRTERVLTDDLRPEHGQVGVVAVVGGDQAVIDLFDKSATLVAYWPSLVSGYALEALGVDETEPDSNWVEQFLADLEAAAHDEVPATGLGEEFHLDAETVAGAGLTLGGSLVHLSAYSISPA